MTTDMVDKHVVALGYYDGFHVGHMAVIKAAEKTARSMGASLLVLTFSEHPLKYLKGDAPDEIVSGKEKIKLIKELGIEIEYLDFNRVKDMEPEEFFSEILVKKYNACGICCGYNYRFGKAAAGTTQILEELSVAAGITFKAVPAVEYKGLPVSSTRIRKALRDGEIEDASKMLGRPFAYTERVVSGDKRGRILGSPTINQYFDHNSVIPKFGVYASKTTIGKHTYKSVTNIGLRPTVDGKHISSETYILGFHGNLYDTDVEVKLISYMRPEVKFSTLDELKNQIQKDAKTAEHIIN